MTAPAPRISVVIPCWNIERYLQQTLSSVAAQSFDDFEVLMVDDGSTDGTLAIMQAWAQKDPRFVALALGGNGGVVAARNAALARARGEFVAMLDSDDIWPPDALALRLEVAQRYPGADVVATDFAWMDEEVPSQPSGRINLGPRAKAAFAQAYATATPVLLEDPFELVAITHFTWTGALLIRRSALDAIGWFDTTFTGPEDTLLWLRLAHRAPFAFLPVITAFYRQRPGSLVTQNKGPKELHYLKVLDWLRRDAAFAARRQIIDALAAECHDVCATYLLREGQAQQALRHAATALKLAPGKGTYWHALAASCMQAMRGH